MDAIDSFLWKNHQVIVSPNFLSRIEDAYRKRKDLFPSLKSIYSDLNIHSDEFPAEETPLNEVSGGKSTERERERESKEKEEASSPLLVEIATEAEKTPEPEAVTTTKLSIFEFRGLFQQAINELMPPGLNNRASELCRIYPKQAIIEAFEITAASGGKTLRYVEEVLKGKPKGVLSENLKPRGRPNEREAERQRILEANADACRKFAGEA